MFLGHLGDVTVEHVAYHLPIIIRDFMRAALANAASHTITPAYIADLFSRSIVAFDEAIAGDVLNLFGGLEGLKNFTDAEIRSIINDQHRGGANWKKARLCMYGTTALVALVDPDHHNLWVANLGDCQAGTFLLSCNSFLGLERVRTCELMNSLLLGYSHGHLSRRDG